MSLAVFAAALAVARALTVPTAVQHESHAPRSVLFAPREVSGTAWAPDETIEYGVHRGGRGWDVMLHGALFAQFIYEPPEFVHRTGGFSSTQASSENWGMLMARRSAGAGRFGVDVMLSLEPWTVPGCGGLNYFQTGEICDGDTIHDRQHPHDLFMELAARYDRPLRGAWRWQVYAGLSGEPALGPPAFPHRTSSSDNPIAPIGHHWLDSTHIAFGVVTAGVFSDRWKLEASAFNGREPDEDRGDIDLGPLDSVSGRITWLPTPRLALQVSAAHLTDTEQQYPPLPRTSGDRFTASLMYQRWSATGLWASTLAYGLNGGHLFTTDGADVFEYSSAAIGETSLTVRDRHTAFGRLEIVGKPGHDLHLHDQPTRILPVTKLQGGYVWHFTVPHASAGIGGSASISLVPEELRARYYGRFAKGFSVFLVVRPPRHTM
jgi:hypothetical protein